MDKAQAYKIYQQGKQVVAQKSGSVESGSYHNVVPVGDFVVRIGTATKCTQNTSTSF